MNFNDARDRYMNDPQFHAVVDQMVHMALSMDMSPGELRIAAAFAELKFFASRPVREAFPHFAEDINREILRRNENG